MCLQVRGRGVCRLCIPVCKEEMRTGEGEGDEGQVGGGRGSYGYGAGFIPVCQGCGMGPQVRNGC